MRRVHTAESTIEIAHLRNVLESEGIACIVRNDRLAGVMGEIDAARATFPHHYVRVMAFDATRGIESVRLAFIVNRPTDEPGAEPETRPARAAAVAATSTPMWTASASGRPKRGRALPERTRMARICLPSGFPHPRDHL